MPAAGTKCCCCCPTAAPPCTAAMPRGSKCMRPTCRAAASACCRPALSACALPGAGRAALIASSRPDLPPDAACNRADYAVPDARVRPLGADDCYRRRTPSMALQVMEVDAIASPAEKPRLKMFQTDTLSINWVE